MSADPGFLAAEQAILSLFQAEWVVGAAPRTPVVWPNAPGAEPTTAVAWVRIAILWGSGQRVALGARLDRYSGVVAVQVFTPLGRGQAQASGLCDAAATIFRGGRVLQAGGRLRFLTGGMTVAGGDARWWQQNITAPFTRDRA